ncbi:uncharacterized protein LOC113761018 isoform X3 [Coffea eugenioides]|uniref:uncharacterized protein LOC113761018 isoform X3 n=1 Tax=Coffea eugenioides TaxID=49369 RepID=UPI000F612BEA|nr:uncharacterized protein LOC113761018 isoform X3 [Coffea eugenioides]
MNWFTILPDIRRLFGAFVVLRSPSLSFLAMASGSDDECMTPEHLLEHPEMKGMILEHPGIESEFLSHVRSPEISSQERSSSDKESLALESIGSSSSQEESGSDKEGEGSDNKLENVWKKRNLEKLPEIAEEAEEEEEYRKAKEWKEWWDRRKKEAKEFDLEGWKERNGDLSHKSREQIREELQEYCKSVPSFPSNLGAIGGFDDVDKSFFVHDVDPELWEKYMAECRESEGFDVVTYPGPSPYILVRPITSYVDYPELHQELIEFATRALEEKQPGYQFLHIERVTGYACSGYMYNITFRAQSADDPDGKSFQAKVYAGINKVEVIFCRPKVET